MTQKPSRGWSRLDNRTVLNSLVLLLRFANIFFLVCVPLIDQESKSLLGSLPIVGFAGIAVVVLLFLSTCVAQFVVRWVWIADILCGVLLLALFGGLLKDQAPWLYYFFAGLLGVCVTGTEIAALRLATDDNKRMSLRKNISLFNALRVLGMALGFLLGCFIAGSRLFADLSKAIIFLSAVSIVWLGFMGLNRFRDILSLEAVRSDLCSGATRINRSAVGILFIIADLIVFTFWYAYIPYRLTEVRSVTIEAVGVFLAIQALAHAGGQLLWRLIVTKTGEVAGYCLSILGHIAIIFVITNTFHFTISQFLGLFVVMGLVNSGTYIASTSWYYSSGYPRSKFSSIAVHQISSNVGKWIGSSLAVWVIRTLS